MEEKLQFKIYKKQSKSDIFSAIEK